MATGFPGTSTVLIDGKDISSLVNTVTVIHKAGDIPKIELIILGTVTIDKEGNVTIEKL